jgi:hypothetical protein
MKPRQIALLVLSLSPGILIALGVSALLAGSVWPVLAGYLAVYAPLTYLAIRQPRRKRQAGVRTFLWIAVGSVVLVPLGFALAWGTRFLHVQDDGPPKIELVPAARPRIEYEVKGLNVRWAPKIAKNAPNVKDFFGIDMSHRGGSTGARPPATIEDGYGNHVSFTEVRPGVLRLEDNAGGFAEVDWNGQQPVLVRSHAVARTPSARGPTSFAMRATGIGQLLLCIAPLTAWMFLTVALRRMADSHARGVLGVSLLFQLAGLAIDGLLLFAIWTGGSRSGEAGIAMAFLILALLALAGITSLLGVGILSYALYRGGDID